MGVTYCMIWLEAKTSVTVRAFLGVLELCSLSQGVVHEDLRLLLETYLPSKKKKVLLGVGDPKIGAAIQEELGYNCQTGGVIAEILRGKSPISCIRSTTWM